MSRPASSVNSGSKCTNGYLNGDSGYLLSCYGSSVAAASLSWLGILPLSLSLCYRVLLFPRAELFPPSRQKDLESKLKPQSTGTSTANECKWIHTVGIQSRQLICLRGRSGIFGSTHVMAAGRLGWFCGDIGQNTVTCQHKHNSLTQPP